MTCKQFKKMFQVKEEEEEEKKSFQINYKRNVHIISAKSNNYSKEDMVKQYVCHKIFKCYF